MKMRLAPETDRAIVLSGMQWSGRTTCLDAAPAVRLARMNTSCRTGMTG